MTHTLLSRRSVLQGAAALGLAAVGTANASGATDGVTLKVLVNTPHLTAFTTVLAPAWARLTGGTLVAAAEMLLKRGACAVYACATHAAFAPGTRDLLENSPFTKVLVSDTVPLPSPMVCWRGLAPKLLP